MRFRFEQTVNSTVVVFERPGSQTTTIVDDNRDLEAERANTATDPAWGALIDGLKKNERRAMELAATNGTVTTGMLAEDAQVTKRTASTVLKGLSERGLLEWVGKGPSDPNQFYVIPRLGAPIS